MTDLKVTGSDGTVYVCTPSVVHVGSRQYGSWLWSARGAGTAEGCVAALCDALLAARRERDEYRERWERSYGT